MMMTQRRREEEEKENHEVMEAQSRRFLFVSSKAKACMEEDEEEMEQDSGGSSEEIESPRSVGRWRRRAKKTGCVHSQILRIREEDSHLGENAIFSAKDEHQKKVPRMDVVLFARPILPCSPLKNTVTALH